MSALVEKAYTSLKQDLLDEKFPVDEIITEQMLVERYGVSRTPVREAITRLIHEGFLNKYTKKGYTVKCNGEKEIQDIEESRFILESGVVDILISEGTDDEFRELLAYVRSKCPPGTSVIRFGQGFHLKMAELTKNAVLCDMLEVLLYKNSRPSTVAYRQNFERYKMLEMDAEYHVPEHEELVMALLQRDAQKAKDILHRDICNNAPFRRR